MKQLLVFLLTLGLFILPGHGFFGAEATDVTRFLDLPDGFGISEEEEDTPEIIDFYSTEYEGDAWFFCLDRSSSMGNLASNGMQKFALLKRETIKALSTMTKRSVASAVFYDKTIPPVAFGDPAIRMDPPGKAKLIGSVAGMQIGFGTCILEGMIKTLEIANKTQNAFRTIILTADGRATCPNGERDPDRVYSQVIARNIFKIPINTIYTGVTSGDDWAQGKPLLERLARATNGKFKIAN